jgi:hypothetical protein
MCKPFAFILPAIIENLPLAVSLRFCLGRRSCVWRIVVALLWSTFSPLSELWLSIHRTFKLKKKREVQSTKISNDCKSFLSVYEREAPRSVKGMRQGCGSGWANTEMGIRRGFMVFNGIRRVLLSIRVGIVIPGLGYYNPD